MVAHGAPVLFVDEDWVAVLAVRSAALGDASVVVVLPVGAPLDVLRVEPLRCSGRATGGATLCCSGCLSMRGLNGYRVVDRLVLCPAWDHGRVKCMLSGLIRGCSTRGCCIRGCSIRGCSIRGCCRWISVAWHVRGSMRGSILLASVIRSSPSEDPYEDRDAAGQGEDPCVDLCADPYEDLDAADHIALGQSVGLYEGPGAAGPSEGHNVCRYRDQSDLWYELSLDQRAYRESCRVTSTE